ncbi:SRPBCC family protein [Cryobacterium tagatosivorans]|uniref:Carbon monoxide dehydrogenase n=1 Tax=Cryobacterium tagatosivorans TaxID=1259199 RepID=A0A4R8UDR6_9MICO|nr:SRPBCC family protein [Cryobacterium tagatosivorans]TFB49503.1 carbon monoxide dehydrogenase [Cryobacterium tagatosivorans]
MELESTFSVVAPIDQVWATIMDFERVAGCVPGAQILNKLSEDAYQVGMKVKLGPVSMQYKGLLNVVERDVAAHRAVFEGKAQEARGQGTAQGTGSLVLVQDGDTTRGTVRADVALSGKVAAMGKGVIGSVTDQMMALFAENLQAMVGAPAAEAAAAGTSAPATEAGRAGGGTGRATPAPAADTSLDAFAFAKGMITDQLSSPPKLLGLLAAVAFIAYRIGRRASRKNGR